MFYDARLSVRVFATAINFEEVRVGSPFIFSDDFVPLGEGWEVFVLESRPELYVKTNRGLARRVDGLESFEVEEGISVCLAKFSSSGLELGKLKNTRRG